MRWRATIEQEARLAELRDAARDRALDLGEGAELEELVERQRRRDRTERCRLPLAIEDARTRLAELLTRAADLGVAVPPEREKACG